jgi:hypothetical protein
MAQNYYLVRCDGLLYANEELYTVAVAKGARTLIKMLANKAVAGKSLLGEIIYPLSSEQRAACEEYQPVTQDFDAAFRHFNIISGDEIRRIKEGCSLAFPGALAVTAASIAIPERFKYRQAVFFKVSDYKEAKKYAMVPKLAAVKVCGRLYVALNAVDVRVETPIIITADK